MKKKEFVRAVPQTIRIPTSEKIKQSLWSSEGPVVLICSQEEDWQTYVLSELLPELAALPKVNDLLYFNPEDSVDASLLKAFSRLFSSKFPKFDHERFSSTDPEEWSLELRRTQHLDRYRKYYLVIDGLEKVLLYPEPEGQYFSTLVSHIACEPNFGVLAIADESKIDCLKKLDGFNHLKKTSEIVTDVPDIWLPPEYIVNRSIVTKEQKKSCLTSNMILGSAFAVSMTSIAVAFWVTTQLNSRRPSISSRSKTISPESTAGMRSLSVASPREIEWGKPPVNRPDTIDEIMSEPIPVAFSDTNDTDPSKEKKVVGKLAEKIDIEAIEKYHSKVFEKLDPKSILSFEPIPNEDKFFDRSSNYTPPPPKKK